jgi:hypothetical protein
MEKAIARDAAHSVPRIGDGHAYAFATFATARKAHGYDESAFPSKRVPCIPDEIRQHLLNLSREAQYWRRRPVPPLQPDISQLHLWGLLRWISALDKGQRG